MLLIRALNEWMSRWMNISYSTTRILMEWEAPRGTWLSPSLWEHQGDTEPLVRRLETWPSSNQKVSLRLWSCSLTSSLLATGNISKPLLTLLEAQLQDCAWPRIMFIQSWKKKSYNDDNPHRALISEIINIIWYYFAFIKSSHTFKIFTYTLHQSVSATRRPGPSVVLVFAASSALNIIPSHRRHSYLLNCIKHWKLRAFIYKPFLG